jgi:hypothetical protein
MKLPEFSETEESPLVIYDDWLRIGLHLAEGKQCLDYEVVWAEDVNDLEERKL